MAIFGHCPTAEIFELAVCNYCGDKFKIPALADHIRLRHEDEKYVPQKFLESPDRKYASFLLKNNKGKHSKINSKQEKSKAPIVENDTSQDQTPTKIPDAPIDDKLVLRESVLTTPDLPRSDLSPVVVVESKMKQLKVNLKKTKVFDKPISTPPQINEKPKSFTNIAFVASPDIKKEKMKNDSNSSSSVKKVNGKPDSSSPPQESTLVIQENELLPNMQPVVQLSPLVGLGKPNSVIDQRKKLKNDKKPTSIRDRTYNPDKHCGVVSGKENTKPCTRSLTCKSHSMTLRRAVKGRSKAFDILLADHRAEKDILRKNNISIQPGIENEKSNDILIKTLNGNDDQMVPTSPKVDNSDKAKIVRTSTKLSLPVSIKNPSLLKHSESIEAEPEEIIEIQEIPAVSNNNVVTTTYALNFKSQVRNALIVKATKEENKINEESPVNTVLNVEIPSNPLNTSTAQQTTVPCVTSQDQTIQVEVLSTGDDTKELNKKVQDEDVTLDSCDGYVQWHPGFRRTRGLLMTTNYAPKMDSRGCSVNLPNARTFNDITDSRSFDGHQIDLTNDKDEFDEPSSPSEMATANLLMPLSDNSVNILRQPDKMIIAQVPPVEPELTRKLRKNKRATNFVSYNTPSKMSKNDVPTNLIGPVVTPNVNFTPVVHLAITSNHIQNQIIHTQEQTTTLITNSPFQNILQTESLRLGHPGIHYITSSGPFPISLHQQPTIFQQVHLDDHFHLLPTITPAGIVYIKSAPQN